MESGKPCKIVKPDIGVVRSTKISDWRFKRGLMVPTGLSFFKKINRLYWYERYRSKVHK